MGCCSSQENVKAAPQAKPQTRELPAAEPQQAAEQQAAPAKAAEQKSDDAGSNPGSGLDALEASVDGKREGLSALRAAAQDEAVPEEAARELPAQVEEAMTAGAGRRLLAAVVGAPAEVAQEGVVKGAGVALLIAA